MKKKIIALFLMGILCFSLAACGDSDVQSVLDSSEAEAIINTIADAAADSDEEMEEEGEEEQLEIPDAIVNIRPEDDKAVTGVLTADSYTNEYFGFKLNKIEGGEIESLLDDGTDIALLSDSYAEGIGCIYIQSRETDYAATLSAMISAITSNEQGKSEQDLTQESFESEQSMNESIGYEAECSVENVNIAGEEHPAFIEIAEDEEGVRKKSAYVYIIKGDFICSVSVNGAEDRFEDLLKYFEKI